MHIGTSPSMCLRLCLPPPFPFTHSSSWSLCVVVSSWLHRVIPSILRLIPTYWLLAVVATSFFGNHFPQFLRLQLRCLDICGTWEIHLHMFWSLFVRRPIHVLSIGSFRSARVVRCVLCGCSIWGIQVFLVRSFFSVHGRWNPNFPSSQLFLQYVSLIWQTCPVRHCPELHKCVCDWFGGTFDLNLLHWHFLS